MRIEKATKVSISNRIHPDNYFWLKKESAKIERSFNWLLDKIITEARLADENDKVVENEHKQ